jgi:hypothetical protein
MAYNALATTLNAGTEGGKGDMLNTDNLVAQLKNPDVTSLTIGGTAVTATAAEINAAADATGRVVTSTDAGTLTLTAAAHAGRIVNFSDADGNIVLPPATGTGDTYRIRIATAFTAGTIKVEAASAAMFQGVLRVVDTDSDATINYPALVGDTYDTITLNGVATGGVVGDWFEFTDVATDIWHIDASVCQSGGSEATPFSSAIS